MGKEQNTIITEEKMMEIVDVRFSDEGMMVDAVDCYYLIPWVPKSLSHYALHSKKLGKSVVRHVAKKTGEDIAGLPIMVPDHPLPKLDGFWNVVFTTMLPFPQKLMPKVEKYLTSLFSHQCIFTEEDEDNVDNTDLGSDPVFGEQDANVVERMWIDCEDSTAIFE